MLIYDVLWCFNILLSGFILYFLVEYVWMQLENTLIQLENMWMQLEIYVDLVNKYMQIQLENTLIQLENMCGCSQKIRGFSWKIC